MNFFLVINRLLSVLILFYYRRVKENPKPFFGEIMTLYHRNNYLTAFYYLSLALSLLFLLLLFESNYALWQASIVPQENLFFWFFSNPPKEISFSKAILSLGGLYGASLLSGILLRRTFRKTASPESFFLAIFAFSLSWEILRLGAFFLESNPNNTFLPALLTRTLYLFRFLGAFSLTFSGLFNLQFQYQKYGVLFFFATVFALLLVSILPLKTALLDRSLILPTFYPWLVGLFFLFCLLLTLFGHMFPSHFQSSKQYLLKAIGIATLVFGGYLSYFSASLGAGALMLLAGSWYTSRKIQRDFLLG